MPGPEACRPSDLGVSVPAAARVARTERRSRWRLPNRPPSHGRALGLPGVPAKDPPPSLVARGPLDDTEWSSDLPVEASAAHRRTLAGEPSRACSPSLFRWQTRELKVGAARPPASNARCRLIPFSGPPDIEPRAASTGVGAGRLRSRSCPAQIDEPPLSSGSPRSLVPHSRGTRRLTHAPGSVVGRGGALTGWTENEPRARLA
jgi:hypothetical protein